MQKTIAFLMLGSLMLVGCNTPLKLASIEVAVLRSPDQLADQIEVSGSNFPASTPLTIEGFTTGSPRALGSITSDAQGAFRTKVTLSCVGVITPKIISVQVSSASGAKAIAKTDRPVCF